MELIVLLVIGGVILGGVVLFMLNRSWGNFPGEHSNAANLVSQDWQKRESAPPVSPSPALSSANQSTEVPESRLESAAYEQIPITHNLIRKSVLSALEQGGNPYALYFIREGEQVFFIPSRIADPEQRALATKMFQELHTGQGSSLPMAQMLQLIQALGRG